MVEVVRAKTIDPLPPSQGREVKSGIKPRYQHLPPGTAGENVLGLRQSTQLRGVLSPSYHKGTVPTIQLKLKTPRRPLRSHTAPRNRLGPTYNCFVHTCVVPTKRVCKCDSDLFVYWNGVLSFRNETTGSPAQALVDRWVSFCQCFVGVREQLFYFLPCTFS